MSFLIESYPLALNGTMGAMGLTAEQRKAQALARKDSATEKRALAQQERQQAQLSAQRKQAEAKAAREAAQLQRQQEAQQRKISAQGQRDAQKIAQQQRQQQQQVQANLRKAEADKRKVVAAVQAEIRQIDAASKRTALPPEWVAYRACLEEKLKDVTRVCAKPGSTIQDVIKAANTAKKEAKQEATKAAKDLRQQKADERKKSAAQKKAEKQKKDKQTVSQITPALKNQLSALINLSKELRRVKQLPAAQRKTAAEAILKKYPSDLLNTDSSAGLKGYGMGMGALGDCKTVYVPGFGWKQICDTVGTGIDFGVTGPVIDPKFAPTGAITAMPDSATYWDQRFVGRIGTKKDLTTAFKACKNPAYKRFPAEVAMCYSSLWEDTPQPLKRFFPKKVVKDYQLQGLRGMGAIDPITGQEIPDVVDPTLAYNPLDPYATGGGAPISTFMPPTPTVPLPKGGCDGKKASKPICLFYTLAVESQQMLYTVIQQIIALQNEILMVLNEIRSTPGGGSGYCDPSTGLWINPDGTTGAQCGAPPVDPNYPPYDPNYPPVYDQPYYNPSYPPSVDPGSNYQTPPMDYGMDFGGDMGVPSDVYPGAPTTPYGYNQPYNPYQEIPDTMQLPADASGGDLFSDGGVDYVPTEVPFNQYAMQQFYPSGAPAMDFQQIPGGMQVEDSMFADEGGGYIPGDISIYGAPSTSYQQASPSLLAPDQTFVLPNYAQSEMDVPLLVQAAPDDMFANLLLPEDPAAKAAQFARSQQVNPYDQNAIFAASFEGGEEDFF